ncbi:hypothetical protein J7E62_27415 [Variovorax paradoxus]|nr:hypothetical protein [Variovorax paradoxus]
MTFDLFGDAAALVCDSVQTAPSSKPTPDRIAYELTPSGLNRWTYKGEIVMYDTHKLAVPGRGRWSSLEGIGKPVIRGESHVDVCRGIDARQGASA